MQALGWADPLPRRPRRVLVTGPSGAGKSTLAAALGAGLGLPYTELDGLFHGPQWVPRPEFAADVTALAAGPEWVTEWQYRQIREVLFARADLLVWLDLPPAVIAARLVRRTLRRRIRRVELWNGNREPPLWTVVTDPEHLLRLARRSYARSQVRMAAVLALDVPTTAVVRLRSSREVAGWLERTIAAWPPSRQNPA